MECPGTQSWISTLDPLPKVIKISSMHVSPNDISNVDLSFELNISLLKEAKAS